MHCWTEKRRHGAQMFDFAAKLQDETAEFRHLAEFFIFLSKFSEHSPHRCPTAGIADSPAFTEYCVAAMPRYSTDRMLRLHNALSALLPMLNMS